MVPIDPNVRDWLEAASYVATVLGIPIAIMVFWFETRRDRKLREEQIYLSPNQLYIEYLKLCLEYPQLDIYDLATPAEQTPENTKRERIAFNILISILEQAYLLYRNHPRRDNKQWQGWVDYTRWWMARPNFKRAWEELSIHFDSDFIAFVNRLPPYELAPSDFSHDWVARGSLERERQREGLSPAAPRVDTSA
jgi:hypothetical protein